MCSVGPVPVHDPWSQSWGTERRSMMGRVFEKGRLWVESGRVKELRMVTVIKRWQKTRWQVCIKESQRWTDRWDADGEKMGVVVQTRWSISSGGDAGGRARVNCDEERVLRGRWACEKDLQKWQVSLLSCFPRGSLIWRQTLFFHN